MTERILAAALALCLLPLLAGCGAEKGGVPYITDTFFSMDTVITVSLDPSVPDPEAVFARCREITGEYRQIFDAGDPASALALFNASADGGPVPEPLSELYRLCADVRDRTGGAFDPSLRPLILLWKNALEQGSVPEADTVDRTLRDCRLAVVTAENGELTKTPGAALDLGGAAKGAAAAAVTEYLKSSAARWGVVSFGGSVSVFGEKPDGSPFRVGIRDPRGESASDCVGTVELREGFVSVSGDYERYYEIGGRRYHHILDPATGCPADSGLYSAAVICRDGALADILSTALFVMGAERAMELYASGDYTFEAVLVASDGTVTVTPGLTDSYFPAGN